MYPVQLKLRRSKSILLICMGILLFSSCVNSIDVSQCVDDNTSGFWLGLWHGFICPFSFIGSLFDENIGLYDINNSGNFYNLGYVLGLAGIFGGGTNARKKRK